MQKQSPYDPKIYKHIVLKYIMTAVTVVIKLLSSIGKQKYLCKGITNCSKRKAVVQEPFTNTCNMK